MKLVSVIIPTYNGSQYVRRAVASVLKQTYKSIEIIVVDDNGLGTNEQKKTYLALEDLINKEIIHYIPHQVNKNGSAARNTGFLHSHGEYIALLDDDDEYMADKIEREVDALENLDEDWGMVYIGSNLRKKRNRKSGDLLFELLIHEVEIGSNAFLIRRSVWERVNGFDESFRRHQDYEFTARVAATCNILSLDGVGYTYNIEVGRNKPKDIRQTMEYRAHYIDKMIPYIRKFDKNKQQFIICSNSMQATSMYLRKGKPITFFRQLLSFMGQWEPKCGFFTICRVGLYKVKKKAKEAL